MHRREIITRHREVSVVKSSFVKAGVFFTFKMAEIMKILFPSRIQPTIGGGVKGVIFKTEETTYQAICL